MAHSTPPTRPPRARPRWQGAVLRLAVVAGLHVAVFAVIVKTDPELRRKLAPVMVSLISPPRPAEPPPPPPPPPKPVPPKASPPRPVTTVASPPPVPALLPATPEAMAITTEPAPSPSPAPALPSPAPQPPAPAPAAPPVVSAAPALPPAPVVPPRFDAAYLNNPAPEYPHVARRMGEHGKVVLRVYVSSAGAAEKIELRSSSGFGRLDQAAREAVQRWRFVPARQGNDPVGAWVLVPITFLLEG